MKPINNLKSHQMIDALQNPYSPVGEPNTNGSEEQGKESDADDKVSKHCSPSFVGEVLDLDILADRESDKPRLEFRERFARKGTVPEDIDSNNRREGEAA